jgi:hypothetical protein
MPKQIPPVLQFRPMSRLILIGLLLVPTLCFGQISIVVDPNAAAPAKHGMDALVGALKAKDCPVQFFDSIENAGQDVIVAGLASGTGLAAKLVAGDAKLPRLPESLLIQKIEKDQKHILLLAGADARGLMYAELDVADRVGWSEVKDDPFHEVHDTSESPDCPERAVSIYTMQRAYFESRLYDEHYWQKYFDLLARDRFNGLVLVFGYENGGFLAPPYPYFFNVDGFPDVRMVGVTAAQQKKNLNALNRLIEMAHERGIDVTLGIWDHIYRGGVQANGVPGTEDALKKPTPGLVWGVTAENLIPYTKAALTKFLQEVHGIDAIQFRMHDESGLKNSEQGPFWAEIARMMQKCAPNIRFDARAKGLPDAVIDDIASTGIPFRVDTKYWMEQMGMPWHPAHINAQDQQNRRHSYADLLRYPQKYKMHWRLWNGGTARLLLWGDPEYVKRFVESTHLYDGDGFEVNEPLCTKMQGQAGDVPPFDLLNSTYKYTEYEFERYWHFFQLFGRLGYNPDTPSEVWDREFVRRFGKESGPLVEDALHKASWILPRIVAACYPYSAFPMSRGWAEKQPLGDLAHYAMNEGSDVAMFASFDEDAGNLLEGRDTAKIRPADTAMWFHRASTQIDGDLQAIKPDPNNKELLSTCTDLRILSSLAQFHEYRAVAAVAYRLYERSQNPWMLREAANHETAAVESWSAILRAAGDVYTDNLMMGNPKFGLCGHWKDELGPMQKEQDRLTAEVTNLKLTGSEPATQQTDLFDSEFRSGWGPGSGRNLEIQHIPIHHAQAGQPITIAAQVVCFGAPKSVRVRFRSVNQRLDYDSLDMSPTQTGYQAIIPAEKIPAKWDLMYYIEAIDQQGHGKIFPDMDKQTPYVVVKLSR